MPALNKLASKIARREGKKSQVKIGDIREVLKVLIHLDADYMDKTGGQGKGPFDILMAASTKEVAKRRKKKK